MNEASDQSVDFQEELWLLGVPMLTDYIDFVHDETLGGSEVDEGVLVDEWRTANDRYSQLEKTEAGIADDAEVHELPSSMQALTAQVQNDPFFRKTFEPLPVAFGMVELDHLIIYQRHVTIDHVENVRQRLGGQHHNKEELFRLCLPYDHPLPEVRMGRTGGRQYVFHSPSRDLRFLGPVLLKQDQIDGFTPFGPAAGVVGLVVGFGSNYLNIIRHGRRMLLNNGYHRAYTLRALGVTHVPCVIQVASRYEELEAIGPAAIKDDPAFYFESVRPPLFKDLFDPDLTRTFKMPRVRKQIQVSFDVDSFLVPA